MYVNLNTGAGRASNQAGAMRKVKNVNTSNPRLAIRTFGAALLGIAVAFAPTLSYAQPSGGHSSGGGGHSSGGGGHSSGGGGHSSGGGGHFGGGHSGGAHVAGGYAPARGFGGAHYAAQGFQGTRSFQGTHGFQGAHGGFAPRPGFSGGHAVAVASSGGRYNGGYHGGYYGGRYWGGAHYWGGGYWGGSFWPHCYFSPGFAWFLPLLPFGYATYWWGGLPYYYYNSLYYTWNPGYSGYVVTDPPPAAGTDSGEGAVDASQYSNPDASQSGGPQAPRAGAQNGGSGEVYVYPRNNQNDQQTSNDRYECHSWAVNQTGFDPTRAAQQSGAPEDYRRAMIACLDARGYTAR
jgi:hypothetical protein